MSYEKDINQAVISDTTVLVTLSLSKIILVQVEIFS